MRGHADAELMVKFPIQLSCSTCLVVKIPIQPTVSHPTVWQHIVTFEMTFQDGSEVWVITASEAPHLPALRNL